MLAERMTGLGRQMDGFQRDVSSIQIKLDRMSSEQATQAAFTDLSARLTQNHEKQEQRIHNLEENAGKRLRELEDWKTGIGAQVKLVYVFAAVVSFAAGLIGHFWK